jgi:predicted AlkP superfamily phosphohydrolase/phosphomutase
MSEKVMIIGLDGGTFEVINPMINKGKLPHIAEIIKKGTSGTLHSSIPPTTPPAWTSFMTGKNPGKHGVLNFTQHEFDLSREPNKNLVNSFSINARTIWEILSEHEKRLMVVNVPMTYPPWEINGIMISGLIVPDEDSDFVYPPEVKREIFEEMGGYRVDNTTAPQTELVDIKCWYFDNEERRHNVALQLLRKYPWDLFMVVYSLTDRIGHYFWHYHDNQNLSNDEDFVQAVSRSYERVDGMIGDLLDTVDDRTTIFIISDHGFGPMEKVFYINKWLFDEGFMRLKKPAFLNFLRLYRLELRKPTIKRAIEKIGNTFLSGMLPSRIAECKIPVPKFRTRSPFHLVDWSKTRAYAGNFGIYLNLKGRERLGIIERGKAYGTLRKDIIERLQKLQDPETGERIVDEIFVREELYTGPFTEFTPDIMFVLKGLRYIQNDSFNFSISFKSKREGTHRKEGIFLAYGKNIRKGSQVNQAQIVDLAPTILHLLGCPVSDDMDGRVLSECFIPNFMKNNPIRYEQPVPSAPRKYKDHAAFSRRDEEKIREGLRGLGYID